MPIGQAVVESVQTRIRPIFMTTLGGLVGLLPLVRSRGGQRAVSRHWARSARRPARLDGGDACVRAGPLSLMMELREVLWQLFASRQYPRHTPSTSRFLKSPARPENPATLK